MNAPKHDEVLILLKLYEMATTPAMREARHWLRTEFQADSYEAFLQQHPSGSQGWQHLNDVCSIMELFGVLVKHGVVDEDLLFDLFGGIDVLWETVAGIMPGMRQAMDPHLYENFEGLYRRAKRWQGAPSA